MSSPRASRLLAASLALFSPLASGQNEARVLEEVRTCAALQRDSVRLACFDAIARAAESEPPAATVPAAPPSPASPVGRAPPAAETFGLPPDPPARAPQTPQEQQLVSSVASLREIQPGRLEITLANGQVWRQVSSDRYALAIGHEVRIYPTRFGSYFRLTAEKLRSFVQVERVR